MSNTALNTDILLDEKRENQGYLPVVTRYCSKLVPLEEILYIERHSRTIDVVTLTERYHYYERVENVLKLLDGHFYRVLKGLMINFYNVRSMQEQRIEFVNGESITIAHRPYCRARQVYSNYILNGRKGFLYIDDVIPED